MPDDHDDQPELFARVDGLLADLSAQRVPLPPPRERSRLRKAAGLSTEQIADALVCRARDVEAWEAGTREPLTARRTAYARLLEGLKTLEKPKQNKPSVQNEVPTEPAQADRPEQPTLFPPDDEAPPSTRRPVTPEPHVAPTGPLAVIDHNGTLIAHFTNGSQLPLDADDLLGLVEWTLRSGLRRDKLSTHDQDGDPLIVLTPAASTALHLPAELADRVTLRLPSTHSVLAQLDHAGFRLTRRGFGPWARTFRPVVNNKRASVQLAVMAWGALSQDGWNLPELPPSDLARLLGTYTDRLLTPRGSTAVCGEELMTALRPPTKPTRDPASGKWVSGPNPVGLHKAFEPAPPEA
ncbi:transcriptional regulator, partial [Streptomyces sp. GC420]|nr:transcriptional regulator [Streptomyces sp. GC420]